MSSAEPRLFPLRPDLLLRVEGLLELIVTCVAYQHLYPGRWGFFALLFLAPDLSLFAYLGKPGRFAAGCYNCLHSYVPALALGFSAWHWAWPLGGRFALIWMAHIAFDRVLGYGLKFPREFKLTHLQACSSPVK